MTSTLSIITGTLNRHEDFYRLLQSIIHGTTVPWQLIVSDASDVPVKCDPPNVTLIREYPPIGCSKAYNAAFRQATGTWCIWLNDDCEVIPGYAEAAISFMEAHSEIGLGALYYREGSRDFHVNSYFSMLYSNFGIIRRELGNQVGWFDAETCPMYGNDNSLAFRVLLAGKGIAGIPDARVIHYATQDRYRTERGDSEQRNRDAEALIAKYGPYMEQMRTTYARLGCESNSLNDQTPGWLEDKIKT